MAFDKNGLTNQEKAVLRKLVYYICQSCGRPEKVCGTLEIHRKTRGNIGGEYSLSNIKIICKADHKRLHENELGVRK